MANPFQFKSTIEGQEGRELAEAIQLQIAKVTQARQNTIQQVYMRAAKTVANADKEKLRQDIISGGFYQAAKLSKTWRAASYPNKGKGSLEPTVWLSTRARVIIDAFSMGATITVHGAQYLAIPEGPAKAIIRRMNLASNRSRNAFGKFTAEDSPVERVAAVLGVKLIAIIGKDGKGVLIAADSRTLTPTGRNAKNQARAATPLFVLTKTATLRKRIKGRDILAELQASFGGDFAAAIAAELPAEDG